MTTTIAIASLKGGVAKTTTCLSLGATLAEMGQTVLLVDLDPQAHLSMGVKPDQVRHTAQDVFLGDALIKSRRAAEVNWQMALPMVALSVVVLLTPVLLVRLESLDGLLAFPLWAAGLVVGSGLIGLLAGALIPLSKAWSRSLNPVLRWFQDLLAYDFYTERFYRLTIVNVVGAFSRLAAWFDRNVVDGVLHGVARLSLQSAEGLKLSVSGQSQSYVLTVLVAIVLFLTAVSWFLT